MHCVSQMFLKARRFSSNTVDNHWSTCIKKTTAAAAIVVVRATGLLLVFLVTLWWCIVFTALPCFPSTWQLWQRWNTIFKFSHYATCLWKVLILRNAVAVGTEGQRKQKITSFSRKMVQCGLGIKYFEEIILWRSKDMLNAKTDTMQMLFICTNDTRLKIRPNRLTGVCGQADPALHGKRVIQRNVMQILLPDISQPKWLVKHMEISTQGQQGEPFSTTATNKHAACDFTNSLLLTDTLRRARERLSVYSCNMTVATRRKTESSLTANETCPSLQRHIPISLQLAKSEPFSKLLYYPWASNFSVNARHSPSVPDEKKYWRKFQHFP